MKRNSILIYKTLLCLLLFFVIISPLYGRCSDSHNHTKPLIAIKSNMLFNLIGIPNVEVEVSLGSKWSINSEFQSAWWVNKKHNRFAFQLLSGGVEGRYWFCNKPYGRIMTGHFAGLHVGGGVYDIQLKKTQGYRGDFYFMGGLSYGYTMPVINENFALEFSLGLGFMLTDYKKYETVENGTILAYRYDGRYYWFGPTKAKISFVWRIGGKKNSR